MNQKQNNQKKKNILGVAIAPKFEVLRTFSVFVGHYWQLLRTPTLRCTFVFEFHSLCPELRS